MHIYCKLKICIYYNYICRILFDNRKRKLRIPFLLNDKKQTGDNIMKEVITLVKDWVDDIAHLLISFVAIGAVGEVLFGSGIFGVNVIGNLTSIINKFGESGFAGLVALLVLVGLFRK